MKNKIRIFILGLILCLSLCRCKQDAEVINYKQAPEFTLATVSGDSLTFANYKGKFVVLHIATTWCPYCNAEAPHLEELYQTYQDKNVEVVIIDVKEAEDLVKNNLKEKYKLSFPVLLDTDGKVAASFAPEDVLPDLKRDEIMLASNVLIDPQGKIQFMSLLDTKNFDVALTDLKKRLNELLVSADI